MDGFLPQSLLCPESAGLMENGDELRHPLQVLFTA